MILVDMLNLKALALTHPHSCRGGKQVDGEVPKVPVPHLGELVLRKSLRTSSRVKMVLCFGVSANSASRRVGSIEMYPSDSASRSIILRH